MPACSTIDLAFPITPAIVPIDHGYLLYSALCNTLPALHGANWLGVHPLVGRRADEQSLLVARGSHLKVRVPPEKIPDLLPLSGKELCIGCSRFFLGPPSILPLVASERLFAWRVAIRLTKPPKSEDGKLDLSRFRESFEAEIHRQLDALEVSGNVTVLDRKILRIKRQMIMTYAVQVNELSAADSLALQAGGIGGKRKMGCGIFCPTTVQRSGPDHAEVQ